MRLKVLGSSSRGNCYILENDNCALIIEAGISLPRLKKALEYNISKVAGCIISHEHGDHASHAAMYLKNGIRIYSGLGTLKSLEIDNHHNSYSIKERERIKIGQFEITPFKIKHDAAEPFGYLINHSDTGVILFITDTYYVPYIFKGMYLNQIMIESNYDGDIMMDNLISGRISPYVKNRTVKNHMSFDTCKEVLMANDLKKVNNILLIHLSETNSDQNKFKTEIQSMTGKKVTIAQPGTEINFNKTDI